MDPSESSVLDQLQQHKGRGRTFWSIHPPLNLLLVTRVDARVKHWVFPWYKPQIENTIEKKHACLKRAIVLKKNDGLYV